MRTYLNGAWREVTSAKVYIGGGWRRITRAIVYQGGQWRDAATFLSPMSVSLSPPSAEGSAFGSTPTIATTNAITATPSGGLGPYSYAWSILSHTGNTVTISNATQATTTFSQIQGPGTVFNSATAQLVVTDALGSTATVQADLTFQKDVF